MYALIDKHPNPREVYTNYLLENGEPDAKELAENGKEILGRSPGTPG